MGENRTLVLIDGRRRVSGSREGSQVDLASIPPGMIDSIEIITGGASAVYGADAVSGVSYFFRNSSAHGCSGTFPSAGSYTIVSSGTGTPRTGG